MTEAPPLHEARLGPGSTARLRVILQVHPRAA